MASGKRVSARSNAFPPSRPFFNDIGFVAHVGNGERGAPATAAYPTRVLWDTLCCKLVCVDAFPMAMRISSLAFSVAEACRPTPRNIGPMLAMLNNTG